MDAKLEVFIQLLGDANLDAFELGEELDSCEAVQEYQRSGSRDLIDQSTDKCKGEEIHKLKNT